MDLKGSYQRQNLRTVLAALSVLEKNKSLLPEGISAQTIRDAVVHAAERTGFRGRWEILSDSPLTIADIGHNEHGLKHNFAQLSQMKKTGEASDLIIVYGSVADKDVDAVLRLIPQDASIIFTQAQSRRSLPATEAYERYLRICGGTGAAVLSDALRELYCVPDVSDAVSLARQLASEMESPAIYIGGSTYVVSEALAFIEGVSAQ